MTATGPSEATRPIRLPAIQDGRPLCRGTDDPLSDPCEESDPHCHCDGEEFCQVCRAYMR